MSVTKESIDFVMREVNATKRLSRPRQTDLKHTKCEVCEEIIKRNVKLKTTSKVNKIYDGVCNNCKIRYVKINAEPDSRKQTLTEQDVIINRIHTWLDDIKASLEKINKKDAEAENYLKICTRTQSDSELISRRLPNIVPMFNKGIRLSMPGEYLRQSAMTQIRSTNDIQKIPKFSADSNELPFLNEDLITTQQSKQGLKIVEGLCKSVLTYEYTDKLLKTKSEKDNISPFLKKESLPIASIAEAIKFSKNTAFKYYFPDTKVVKKAGTQKNHRIQLTEITHDNLNTVFKEANNTSARILQATESKESVEINKQLLEETQYVTNKLFKNENIKKGKKEDTDNLQRKNQETIIKPINSNLQSEVADKIRKKKQTDAENIVDQNQEHDQQNKNAKLSNKDAMTKAKHKTEDVSLRQGQHEKSTQRKPQKLEDQLNNQNSKIMKNDSLKTNALNLKKDNKMLKQAAGDINYSKQQNKTKENKQVIKTKSTEKDSNVRKQTTEDLDHSDNQKSKIKNLHKNEADIKDEINKSRQNNNLNKEETKPTKVKNTVEDKSNKPIKQKDNAVNKTNENKSNAENFMKEKNKPGNVNKGDRILNNDNTSRNKGNLTAPTKAAASKVSKENIGFEQKLNKKRAIDNKEKNINEVSKNVEKIGPDEYTNDKKKKIANKRDASNEVEKDKDHVKKYSTKHDPNKSISKGEIEDKLLSNKADKFLIEEKSSNLKGNRNDSRLQNGKGEKVKNNTFSANKTETGQKETRIGERATNIKHLANNQSELRTGENKEKHESNITDFMNQEKRTGEQKSRNKTVKEMKSLAKEKADGKSSECTRFIKGQKLYRKTQNTPEQKRHGLNNLETRINFSESSDLNDENIKVKEQACRSNTCNGVNAVIKYELSDKTFIEKGWTILPKIKMMRKTIIYRMRPARPEFDWFERNKHKKYMEYDTGEKLVEFDDDGRGRWYYRNGQLALDFYISKETEEQRYVVYSSGDRDERGLSRPITVLATFDFHGNGVVFDHTGKTRLRYNQREGEVLDKNIGPLSRWKWHNLNQPAPLETVAIDTCLEDPEIENLTSNEPRQTKKETQHQNAMPAMEYSNIIKVKCNKQKFKTYQIKVKVLKINDQFSLRIIDQKTIYLLFNDGSANMKLNLGMVLDDSEIVDVEEIEILDAGAKTDLLAKTESIAKLQLDLEQARHWEKEHMDRYNRLHKPYPEANEDILRACTSKPIQRQVQIMPSYCSYNRLYNPCSEANEDILRACTSPKSLQTQVQIVPSNCCVYINSCL